MIADVCWLCEIVTARVTAKLNSRPLLPSASFHRSKPMPSLSDKIKVGGQGSITKINKHLSHAPNIAVRKELRGGWGKGLSEGGLCARLKWI